MPTLFILNLDLLLQYRQKCKCMRFKNLQKNLIIFKNYDIDNIVLVVFINEPQLLQINSNMP